MGETWEGKGGLLRVRNENVNEREGPVGRGRISKGEGGEGRGGRRVRNL